MALPIAIQLYTVRDALQQGFADTLRRLAAIGYEGVEWAGDHGDNLEQTAQLLNDLGLRSAGAHVALEALDDAGLPQAIDTAHTLGHGVVTAPYLSPERRTRDGYLAAASRMNAIGAQLKAAGLQLAYHNHDFEFEPLDDGSRGIDLLIAHADAELVHFELDLGWVYVGGESPTGFASQLGGRLPLVHVKDFRAPAADAMTEVGAGVIDYGPVCEQAASWGTRWLIVELDDGWVGGDPLRSAAISYENLRAING